MSLIMMLASLAFAQDGDNAGIGSTTYLDSNIYRPPIETDGMLWTEDAGVAPDGLSTAALHATYLFDPLTSTFEGDDESASQALRMDVMGAAAIRGVQIGLDVPVWVVNDDAFYNGETSLGDLALDVKGGLIESGEDNPVNVGAGARIILPTASENLGAGGIDAVGWEARVLADGEIADAVKLAANVGTRGLPDEIVETDGFNTQFFFRAGAGYDIVEDAGVSLDVAGAMDYDTPVENQDAPIQGILGGYGRIGEAVVLKGGLGSGLIPGVEGAHPRATLGIAWQPTQGVDEDLDTVGNNMDQCPGQAEDVDMFEDEDGCPDVDNDRDNVADLADQCPDEAEDLDGLQDDDGCADAQNRVSIRVRDASGQVLPAADVRILKDGQPVDTGKGSFDAELEPGVYELEAVSVGYEPVKTQFRVYPNDVVQVSATLTKGTGDMERPSIQDGDLPREDALQPAGMELDHSDEFKGEMRDDTLTPEGDLQGDEPIEGEEPVEEPIEEPIDEPMPEDNY